MGARPADQWRWGRGINRRWTQMNADGGAGWVRFVISTKGDEGREAEEGTIDAHGFTRMKMRSADGAQRAEVAVPVGVGQGVGQESHKKEVPGGSRWVPGRSRRVRRG